MSRATLTNSSFGILSGKVSERSGYLSKFVDEAPVPRTRLNERQHFFSVSRWWLLSNGTNLVLDLAVSLI